MPCALAHPGEHPRHSHCPSPWPQPHSDLSVSDPGVGSCVLNKLGFGEGSVPSTWERCWIPECRASPRLRFQPGSQPSHRLTRPLSLPFPQTIPSTNPRSPFSPATTPAAASGCRRRRWRWCRWSGRSCSRSTDTDAPGAAPRGGSGPGTDPAGPESPGWCPRRVGAAGEDRVARLKPPPWHGRPAGSGAGLSRGMDPDFHPRPAAPAVPVGRCFLHF